MVQNLKYVLSRSRLSCCPIVVNTCFACDASFDDCTARFGKESGARRQQLVRPHLATERVAMKPEIEQRNSRISTSSEKASERTTRDKPLHHCRYSYSLSSVS